MRERSDLRLVWELSSMPRVMSRSGGLALDLSVNREANPCATAGSKRLFDGGAPASRLDWEGLPLHRRDAEMCV